MGVDPFNVARQAFLEQVAADSGNLPALATPVAVFVARYVNRDTGDAWPSLATLCAHLRKAERTVQRALRALADHGHIIIEAGGGRRNTNRYRWVLKPAGNPVQDDTLSDENPDQNDTRTSEEPLKEILPLTPSKARTKEAPDATAVEFQAWWAHYPRKDAKGPARKAYASARKKASAEELIAGRDRYADRRRHEDPRYTKHAATWLNAECWNDEPAPAHVLPAGSDVGSGARPAAGRPGPFSASAHLMQRFAAATQTTRTIRELDAAFGSTLDLEAGR